MYIKTNMNIRFRSVFRGSKHTQFETPHGQMTLQNQRLTSLNSSNHRELAWECNLTFNVPIALEPGSLSRDPHKPFSKNHTWSSVNFPEYALLSWSSPSLYNQSSVFRSNSENLSRSYETKTHWIILVRSITTATCLVITKVFRFKLYQPSNRTNAQYMWDDSREIIFTDDKLATCW